MANGETAGPKPDSNGTPQHLSIEGGPVSLPAVPSLGGPSCELLIEHVHDLVLIGDPSGRITWVAPSSEHVLGYRPLDLVGKSLYTVCYPDDATHILGLLSNLLEHDDMQDERPTATADVRFLHQDGSWRDMDVRAIDLREHAEVGGILLVAHDVTRYKRAAQQLQRHALFDPLTGLPNRTLFLTWLDHALARADRGGDPVVLMFMDVDNLDLINVRYGRAAGDLVLVDIARRLQSSLRASDTAARFGDDELIVLLEGVADEREAGLIANRVTDALREPVQVDDQAIPVTLSIGVTLRRGRSGLPGAAVETGAGDLLRDADIALSRAKSGGKNRWTML